MSVHTGKMSGSALRPNCSFYCWGKPHTPFVSELKILPELFRKPLLLFALTIIIILWFYKQKQKQTATGVPPMKYLSIAQTAERWGISTRRIQILCGEGRVPGAIRIGTVWGIPEDAEKPADARIKNGKYIKKPAEGDK